MLAPFCIVFGLFSLLKINAYAWKSPIRRLGIFAFFFDLSVFIGLLALFFISYYHLLLFLILAIVRIWLFILVILVVDVFELFGVAHIHLY